jgi:hypothetical protein
MIKLEVPISPNWTSRNSFEDACLSSMADFGQTTPLYHAAVLRWPEMSQFLMEHGAGPQNDSFYTNNRRTGGKSSVLSRLIATTANMRDEVQDFLTMACRLGHKDLVKPQDILAIFVLNRHLTDAMQWSDTGLTWLIAPMSTFQQGCGRRLFVPIRNRHCRCDTRFNNRSS